ncbi:MAG: hypothetical protein ACI4CS_10975 [Candidatus Weimeria sp.]
MLLETVADYDFARSVKELAKILTKIQRNGGRVDQVLSHENTGDARNIIILYTSDKEIED